MVTEKIFTVGDAIEAVEMDHYDDYNNRFATAFERDGKLIIELSTVESELAMVPTVQRFVFTGVEEEIQ